MKQYEPILHRFESRFAEQLEEGKEVAVYVKLPSGFCFNTPVGKYNPDWAIAFTEGTVKHSNEIETVKLV